ncbi:MAG: arginine--tRNA ligase, partial [Candidatus Bathyarchaeota archaeon]
MVSESPLAEFQAECTKSLEDALKKVLPETEVSGLSIGKPPSPDFGQLASSLCFELAKKVEEEPLALAERIVDNLDLKNFSLIRQVVPAGSGYINFHVDFAMFSGLTIDSVRHFGEEYGFVKTDNPMRIIVEHTSANPLSPIHIGQARNPILGDTIARILKRRGHTVYCHYYVDDVGRQS